MKIKDKGVVFDNELKVSFGDTFEVVKAKIEKNLTVHCNDEMTCISFESEKCILNCSGRIKMYFDDEDDYKLFEIHIDLHSDDYKGAHAETYADYMEANKEYLNALRANLLETYPDGEVVEDAESNLSMIKDDVALTVGTGRSFECVSMSMYPREDFLEE